MPVVAVPNRFTGTMPAPVETRHVPMNDAAESASFLSVFSLLLSVATCFFSAANCFAVGPLAR